jgi:nitrite reductase/ring-hydroxylating ferredoxin subunit
MFSGIVAGYGTFAGILGRFLFPSSDPRKWQLVIDVPGVKQGESLTYVAPNGQRIVITRVAETGAVDDFIALSSVCPHLGCQVHWEPQNNRFFCPCHNGAFDPEGNPTAGPPKDAGQTLPRYPLRIVRRHENDAGLLYIHVETERLVAARAPRACPESCREFRRESALVQLEARLDAAERDSAGRT